MSNHENISAWYEKIQEIQKPNSHKWETKLNEKLADLRARGSIQRHYVILRDTWITSSIRYNMDAAQRGVFADLIVLSGTKFAGPVPGLISDNDLRSRPLDKIAHQLFIDLDLLLAALEIGVRDDSIYINAHGIFLTHFDDYQISEYDRQKPYRDRKRRRHQRELTPEQIEEINKENAERVAQFDARRGKK